MGVVEKTFSKKDIKKQKFLSFKEAFLDSWEEDVKYLEDLGINCDDDKVKIKRLASDNAKLLFEYDLKKSIIDHYVVEHSTLKCHLYDGHYNMIYIGERQVDNFPNIFDAVLTNLDSDSIIKVCLAIVSPYPDILNMSKDRVTLYPKIINKAMQLFDVELTEAILKVSKIAISV